jgi:hypothetical protein
MRGGRRKRAVRVPEGPRRPLEAPLYRGASFCEACEQRFFCEVLVSCAASGRYLRSGEYASERSEAYDLSER